MCVSAGISMFLIKSVMNTRTKKQEVGFCLPLVFRSVCAMPNLEKAVAFSGFCASIEWRKCRVARAPFRRKTEVQKFGHVFTTF